MATKPTVRIPLWASGGTTTDPGGAKEAAGWIVSEKPPATWFNWLFNALGQWIGWAETSIDDLEAETLDLDTRLDLVERGRINALGVVETGATPSIIYNRAAISSLQYSGSVLIVNLSVTYASADQMILFASATVPQYNLSAIAVDTDSFGIAATNTDTGASVDLSSTAVTIHLMAAGSLT